MSKKPESAAGDLYEPKVEIAPRGPIPPQADSVAFQPIRNDRDADLIAAKKKYAGASIAANRHRHDALVAAMRSGN